MSYDLILVDGSSFMFRAYHSSLKKNFRNSKGEPVGAVMIFAKMLTALRAKYDQIPCIMVFDAPVHCFRYEIYSQYKANRKAMDEDLKVQCPRIREVSAAMGCDVIEVAGYEADDVIGTYAKQGEALGQSILICTGDKDLYQLVGDRIVIENTMTDELIDRASGQEKYGVPPELMIDFLALVGDSSDNIPGMAGTGPKTAEAVLKGIGPIDEIAKNPEAAAALAFRGSKNFPEKFRASLDDILMSRRLATIVCDVPVPLAYSELKWRAPDYEQLGRLYLDCGLKALYAALPKNNDEHEQGLASAAETKEAEIPPCMVVADMETVRQLVRRASDDGYVLLCPETASGDYMTADVVGLGVALSDRSSYYIPFRHAYLGVQDQLDEREVLACFRNLLESEKCRKVVFDAKTAFHLLKRREIDMAGRVCDPQLEAWLLDSSQGDYSLAALSDADLELPDAFYAGKGRKQKLPLTEVQIEAAAAYAGSKMRVISKLHEECQAGINQSPELERRYLDFSMPMLRVLLDMENNGVLVSVAELNRISNEFSARAEQLKDRIYELAGRSFNIASPKQVAEVLFEEQKMRPNDPALLKKVEAGRYTTNEEMLSDLSYNYELPSCILEYRGLTKLIGTYAAALPELINPDTGRIHTTFHLSGTSTGRLSSSDPNLQNIPVRTAEGRRIRGAFTARAGYKIVAADYSQIELRILAHLSGDRALVDSFVKGEDIHRRTAAEILGIPFDRVTQDQRRNAKAVNFGILYGMSAFGLSKQLKIDRNVAQRYINGYFQRYPSIRTYLDSVVEEAKKTGYVVSITGRRIPIRDIQSPQQMLLKAASRVATNAPMQGSAADIIQLAMLEVQRFIKNEAEDRSVYMLLQVHDELVFEIREDLAAEYAGRIGEIMSSAYDMKVPLEVGVGIGDSWEQAH